jgi:prepilin-type N-terminal cleavage/methylation domain-containing protein/prepilin-type processing-associated H-X9-DG protein
MPRRNRGFTLIELLVVIGVISILTALTLGAVQQARTAALRASCANNLRQLSLALQQHHDSTGRFPPGIRVWGDKYPYASWITRILPQLENTPAWSEAVVDYASQPVCVGPPPHRNLSRTLPVVLCPTGPKQVGTTDDNVTAAFTYYLGVSGGVGARRDGVFFLDSAIRLGDITDGSSQTLLIGERPPSPDNHFGWWYAGQGQQFDGSGDFLLAAHEMNRTFRAPTCPVGPYPFRGGKADDMCDTFHFWSFHSGGANFAFADGSVRFLTYSADPIMPALATRAGGEVATIPD